MKKLLSILILLISITPTWFVAAAPAFAQQLNTTAGCQQLYGSQFVYNGTSCVNSNVTPPQTNSAPSNTAVAQNTTAPCTNCNLGYTALEPIPGVTSDTNALVAPNNLHVIINAIFKILITAGALIAVLSLTIGGVQYMVSSSAGGKNAGIQRAQASLWAILLIAGSWLILNTINPNLLNFNLNPCPAGGTSNCTVTSNASNSTVSAPSPTLTQLTPDQMAQDGLTGKLQDATTLTYNAQNLPTAEQQNTFTNNCTQKGGKVAANQVAGGFICETPAAYSTDPSNSYINP